MGDRRILLRLGRTTALSVGLPDLELQHRKLQNDYGSVLSSLKSLIDRAKDADGLAYELDVQRQLTMERFHFVMERDETDYDSSDLDAIQNKVNKLYPPDGLWMPPIHSEKRLQ